MEQKTVSFEIRVLGNLLRREAAHSDIRKHVDTLSATNGWVIGFIAEHGDRDIFQRDLETRFSIRRSTASKILQLMERKGLIERQSVDYDARLKKLVLTPKALELHKLATKDMQALGGPADARPDQTGTGRVFPCDGKAQKQPDGDARFRP